MKTFTLMGLALCALASISHAPTARAQDAVPIVITGSREPLPADRLAADVVVISEQTIRKSSADSVADLLRREAGLQLSRTGGPGQASSVFIRGANSGQTVVLVDGVRVGSATLGSASLEALSLAQVERIEVLRGPGSSLYGADAVGGVVQIFTRRGETGARFDARAALGGYGGREVSAGMSGSTGGGTSGGTGGGTGGGTSGGTGGGTGGWDYAASLSREQGTGVSALRPSADSAFYKPYNPDKDGFRLSTAQAQLGFAPAPGHRVGLSVLGTRLNAQYDASEAVAPDFVPDNTPDFRNRQRTQAATLDWRGTLTPTLNGSAKATHSLDDVRSGVNDPGRFRTTRQHASAQLAWDTGVVGQLVAAVEHSNDKARSTSFVAAAERSNNAVVLALAGDAAGWSWQGDLRHDRSSDFGGVSTGRLGGSVVLAPGLRLRALAGTTFLAPSFNDLYFPGYGVPTLQPERGRSVELGLSWRVGSSEAAATVYRNRVRELIGYESDRSLCPPDAAYDFGCARNINRARLQGATLSGTHRVGDLALRVQVDFLDAKNEVTGARLPRRAAHQETLGADWALGAGSIGASVLRIGARPDGGKQLGAQTTLDLTAGWRLDKSWSLQAKVLNATDRDIEPARDYRGLGRQAWVAMRFEGGL